MTRDIGMYETRNWY